MYTWGGATLALGGACKAEGRIIINEAEQMS
jgi:hypothetical protein